MPFKKLPSGIARRRILALLAACAAFPALAAPRLPAPGELLGREVWSLDETRIGTVVASGRACPPEAALVAPAPGLGIGAAPLAIPLPLLREASEGRLLLIMGPGEFQARVAAARLAGP